MFVRVKQTPNSPRRSVQVCESRRVGTTVKQVIVRHVGIAMDERELDALKALAETVRSRLEAERSDALPLFPPEQIARAPGAARQHKRGRKPKSKALAVDKVTLDRLEEEARVVEGIPEIFGRLFRDLGFDQILEPRASEVLLATVLARVADPQSKHRTAALLERDFAISLPLDRIYRMLDLLWVNRDRVQTAVHEATLRLFPGKVDIVFFDVTTLYFESVEADGLRQFGYSKDQKYHSVQVVLALATTEKGLPIGYKLFSGATAEAKTLLACLAEWKQRFEIGHVIFVADRAMMSEANLKQLEDEHFEFIVAASLRKMPAAVRQKVLDGQAYRLAPLGEDVLWVGEFQAPGNRRLIASYSSRRARKDLSDRQRILDKLKKRIGKAQKGDLKRLVSNQGYLKYSSSEGKAEVAIDDDKVARDAAWDGMHGVVTNSSRDRIHVLSRYRHLWTIEAAFRLTKNDLRIRPIFHFKPERIEAHVALCFLAYALAQHAAYRVSLQQLPMSFDVLRNELLSVQASVLRDKETQARYRLPSNMSQAARQIYRAFAVDRSLTPSLITAPT